MLKRSHYWVLSVIGALCVVIVIVNMGLFSSNRSLQTQVNQRNQYIQQSLQLQGLYQQIVRSLADLTLRNHDEQLRNVLAKQGINVTASAQPPAGTAVPAQGKAGSAEAAGKSEQQEKSGAVERTTRGGHRRD